MFQNYLKTALRNLFREKSSFIRPVFRQRFLRPFGEDFPEAEEVTFTFYRSNVLIKVPQLNGEAKKFQEESGGVDE